jgi:HTH-type transcriptional regulator / antitoxin HipB
VRIRTPAEIGQIVKAARHQQGRTQAQLAESIGASRKWIVDLEAGRTMGDVGLILRVLNALGLDLHVEERRNWSADTGIDLDEIVRGR